MKTYRHISLLLILLLAMSFLTISARDEEKGEGTLFPGESYTFKGVMVTWEVTKEDAETTGPLGKLHFKGPNVSITDVSPPMEIDPKGRVIEREDIMAYLDDVVFDVSGKGGRKGVDTHLEYSVFPKPSKRTFTGRPYRPEYYFVSQVTPLFLNEWKLSVSDEKITYPDSSEYYELVISNSEAGAIEKMPLSRGARRKFGRFDIQVYSMNEETGTACLSIQASEDTSIQGGDTYVRDWRIGQYETWGEFLEATGKEFGFEVEWVEFPGHPESVEYAKNRRFGYDNKSYSGRVVREILGKWENESRPGNLDALTFEWKDPTHLRVWAKNYDKYKERELQKKQERERIEAEQEQQRKELIELFEKEYKLETRLYYLKKITPVTAKVFIDPEINRYFLLQAGEVWPIVEDAKGEKRWFVITSEREILKEMRRESEEIPLNYIIREAREQAVADDKANLVIVTAIPKTHEKIEQLLAKIDGMLEEKVSQKKVERYKLEVVLLRGIKAGLGYHDADYYDYYFRGAEQYKGRVPSRPSTQPGAVSLSFRIGGQVVELPHKTGDKVKKGDIIARLDANQQELKVKQLELDVKTRTQEFEKCESLLSMVKKRHEVGRDVPGELGKTQSSFEASKNELEKALLSLELAQKQLEYYTLKAPEAGTLEVYVVNNKDVEKGQTIATLVPEKKAKGVTPTPEAKETPTPTPTPTPQTTAERYGLTEKDLKLFDLDRVDEMGKSFVALLAERGEAGKVQVSLTDAYSCVVEFRDERAPYLIVKGRLLESKTDKTLIENTLYLEKDKPSLLGLTNMREALILVLRLH